MTQVGGDIRQDDGHLGLAGRMAQFFLNSSLTPLLILVSLLLGLGATLILPREEEPQISVPMLNVMVGMPGVSAQEVEQRLTTPLEKLIRELPGVEYVYSTSAPEGATIIVRFLVGTRQEDALVRLYSKVYANLDRLPLGASPPLVKAHSIDDVPILALTFSSDSLGAYELRAVALQVEEELKAVPDVSEATLMGGLKRELSVELEPIKLAAHGLDPAMVAVRLPAENVRHLAGPVAHGGRSWKVEAGQLLTSRQEVEQLIVGVWRGQPVRLGQVAKIIDGPQEPEELAFQGLVGTAAMQPAVTLALAKRAGANATVVAQAVLEKLESLKGYSIPAEVTVSVSRDYGQTAAERSDELLVHMLIAVVSVTALIWVALGKRESWVVAISIPVTLALTLATFVLFDFTLNRVTFFALIFSIGILVDDAIVVVENVVRHFHLPQSSGRPRGQVVLEAVAEVGNPTILATLAVIAAILPMAFVSGLMGPYMLPIPLGASAAMLFSLLVAFTVVPWASLRLLNTKVKASPGANEREDLMTRVYRRAMDKLLHRPWVRASFFASIVFLLLAAVALIPLRLTLFKMLPFDNKSEFQVLVDMPEGTTLEETLDVLRKLAAPLDEIKEVVSYQAYAGTSAPFNFNGLVRQYFMRTGRHQGDLQVNLLPKDERARQSHEIAQDVRQRLAPLAKKLGAVLQVAEIPPGPPVLQTLVTEVYGPTLEGRLALAKQVKELYEKTEGVVDVDWYVEDPQPLLDFKVDRERAGLAGLSSEAIATTLNLATTGQAVGLLHSPLWREDVPLRLRLSPGNRATEQRLLSLRLQGQPASGLAQARSSGQAGGDGQDLAGANGMNASVPLASVVTATKQTLGPNIYHKNLLPVVYVTGDVSGGYDSPLYSIADLSLALRHLKASDGRPAEQYFFSQPTQAKGYSLKWDGEWQVTYEVFRDMGLAFAVVVVLIYALMVGWFENFLTPLVILSAIPFSLVGIMPAHWLSGAFFTATSMIGFIAGGGIVVRNSIILVDFIELRLKHGDPLDVAVIEAGAVRFRPMLLTAAALIAGGAVMLSDPIFNGLAISLMAGEVASLLLSRTAVPVLYYVLWKHRYAT